MGVRILLACGGTGGHVFPAIAAGRALRDTHGATIAMAGRQGGIEERIAAREGVEFIAVPAVPLARGSIRRNLTMPFALLGAFRAARGVVAGFRPDAVLATGGYVSLPTGLAAASRGVPLFLQEQNAAPGVANRILGRFSRLVFAGSPAASRVFDADRVVVSGNPTRPLDARSRQRCREELGLAADGRVLLILGGSQGALGINRILSEEHPALLAAGWTIIWQTGPREHEALASRFAGVAGLRVSAFIEDVYAAMGAADLAISRSGASTIAELALHGLPALFVPFPFATGNHQEANARELEATGAASVLLESAWKPGDALRLVEELAVRGEAPRQAMRAFSRPEAAADIAARILQEIGGPR